MPLQPAARARRTSTMSETLPTISIVTPSFNQGQFLSQTIGSVVSQDYDGLHYCVMDGGSSDDSVSIIRRYADRLDHWQSGRDGGQSDAIASGFELSDCELMGWVNSDDFLLPGALRAVGEFFLRHPHVEVVSCGCLTVDAESRTLHSGFGYVTQGVAATFDRLRYLEAQDGVFQPATFWRRTAYREVGGLDRGLRFTMDLDLFTRLARRRRFARLSRVVACFRLHDSSKSSRMQSIRSSEIELYRLRYGTATDSRWYRSLRYLEHRIPSLARKIALRGVNSLREPRSFESPEACQCVN